MRRIGIGMAAGLAIWLGSAAIAEAQSPTITPTGPLCVVAGQTSSTFTATVYIPVQMNFAVKLWVLKNGQQQHVSTTSVPNPGTSTYYFSKLVDMTAWSPSAGDTLIYRAQLLYNKCTYNADDWTVIVTATRPTKSSSYHKAGSLALQSVDRDRRRE